MKITLSNEEEYLMSHIKKNRELIDQQYNLIITLKDKVDLLEKKINLIQDFILPTNKS